MRYLAILILFLTGTTAGAQLTYQTLGVQYDSAWEFQSLKVIPIRTKMPGGQGASDVISLSKALREGIATISERGTASTENVHWLRINNRSGKTIYAASGETFSGGRQDRMVTRDTLLAPTNQDQYIAVMCIEEGRWSEKEKKIMYTNFANPRLRKVLDKSKNQVLVWKEILSQLDSAHLKAPTFAYNSLQENKAFQLAEAAYLKYFLDKFKNSDSTVTGFVCVSGDKVIGSDIFQDHSMFYDQLEPLLGGYIIEAVINGNAPVLSDGEIKTYMDQVLTNETMQEEYCKKNGKIFRVGNKVIHVTSY